MKPAKSERFARGHDLLTPAALQTRFSDKAKCLAFLEQARWPAGPVCPRCDVIDRASRITTRPGRFTCLDCAATFSVTAGTPMHRTHMPICTWLIAAYLVAFSSKCISSLKLANLLGLQYRTTWHLAHRIRAMMNTDPGLLTGIVELDETYVDGKPRAANKPEPPAPVPILEPGPAPKPEPKPKDKKRKAGRGTDKPMAFMTAARGGQVRLTPMLSHSTAAFAAPVLRWVDRAAIIATDELPAYLALGRRQAGHIRVNHSAGEYIRDDTRSGLRAHVNTAGSGKHMGRYLRESNNRGLFEGRLLALFGTKAGPLSLHGLFA